MKKAVGYVRVSTNGQAENGISMKAQASKIKAWAEVNECLLVETLEDAGISGKRQDNREGLQKAIERACEEKGVLVVYSLSRLARSTKDAIQISEKLHKAGADLVSISEKIDTTSAAGKMVFRLLAVLAEFESDLVSERTKTALDYKKKQGKRTGTIPFGFRVGEDNETLEIEPKEKKIIDRVKDLRASGLKLREIQEELQAQGIKTRKGNGFTTSAICKIVNKAS